MAMGEFVLMGLITNAHGLDGTVKIKSFTERPADLAAYGTLWDQSGGRAFALKLVATPKKDMLLARIEGIEDRNAAEALKGQELFAKRSQMPRLVDEQFYQADLIGLTVQESGRVIGKVAGIENYNAGDLLNIRLSEGEELILPFTRAFFPDIDFEAGVIHIHRPAMIDAPAKEALDE